MINIYKNSVFEKVEFEILLTINKLPYYSIIVYKISDWKKRKCYVFGIPTV